MNNKKMINIFQFIRRAWIIRPVSLAMIIVLFIPFLYTTPSYALTSGPTQEEFNSFEPATTSDLVDIYSGDFTYNIPLISIPGPNGGYPINLAYHSGVGMEQEASWVGLGWTLNVGALNRQLRGLPDDFKGDEVQYQLNSKKSFSAGVDLPLSSNMYEEQFTIPQPIYPSNTYQFYYNNYKGFGYRMNFDLLKNKSQVLGGLDLTIDSQSGIGISPTFGLPSIFKKLGVSNNLGFNFNSRTGLNNVSISQRAGGNLKGKIIHSEGVSEARGGTSSISFNKFQNIPAVNIPTKSLTFPFTVRLGEFELQTTGTQFTSSGVGNWNAYINYDLLGTLSDYNNDQKYLELGKDGYGFLNSDMATSDDIRDANEGTFSYSKKVPFLGVSTYTNDVFAYSGQGAGGNFIPHRRDISVLASDSRVNKGITVSPNFEWGNIPPSTHYHLGIGGNFGISKNSSGDWVEDGTGLDYLNNSAASDKQVYFKLYGEKSGEKIDDNYTERIGGDKAIRVGLEKSGGWLDREWNTSDEFLYDGQNTGNVLSTGDNYDDRGEQRQQNLFQYLTKAEAKSFGITRNNLIYSDWVGFTPTDPNNPYLDNIPQVNKFPASPDARIKDHHISEVNITQSNGLRYSYGLPAYNWKQHEVTLSVDDIGDHNTNTITLTDNGSDKPEDYESTFRQYFSRTITNNFAHSWLLTSVMSDDYIDRGDIGPSDEDYGYWVKFSYKKTADSYKWRVPYENAKYIEGERTDDRDDMAYYTYGEKELFYIEKMETKTHVMIFYSSPREDGVEAKDEVTGGLPSGTLDPEQKMYKLDRIELFTKNEYYLPNGNLNPSAVALKRVHFEYNYDLCPNVPNNTGAAVNYYGDGDVNTKAGKLTLKKVYFTYEKSLRGEISPYVFNYDENNDVSNPGYNSRDMDRWGSFKPNDENYDAPVGTNHYPYVNLPYTEQDEEYMDPYNSSDKPLAGQWSLKEILLPTGGTMKINYESDDYAFEENQHAMRMFDIAGVGANGYSTLSTRGSSIVTQDVSSKVDDSNGDKIKDAFRIYFKLEDETTEDLIITNEYGGDEGAYILDRYVRGFKKLYFNTSIDLKNFGDKYEQVKGYADIVMNSHEDYTGVDGAYGYISVHGENLGGGSTGKFHPFRKAAFQHLKLVRPDLAYSMAEPQSDDNFFNQFIALFNGVFDNIADIPKYIVGFNLQCMLAGYGKKIQLNGRSIIRLADPDGFKYGGGSRVSELSIVDNWTNNDGDAEYGQKYDYTIEENGRIISSGVAYEPSIGADENALTQPVEYSESNLFSTNQNLFAEKPVLRSYYPGASVGYRRVKVKSIAPDIAYVDDNSNLLASTAAPYSIYNFYTPKDFPVLTDETDMSADHSIIRPIMIPGIYSNFKKKKARSQGFSIVLNDMAGKPKSIETRTLPSGSSSGRMLSKTEYKYRTEDEFSESKINRLDNRVYAAKNNGNNYYDDFETVVLGETSDIHVFRNENKNEYNGGGLEFNFEFFNAFLLTLFPQISTKETSLKTISTTKVIHRAGILDEVIVTTDQSTINTKNLVFDIETGSPILTLTSNEYDDPVYSLNYPAHWYYDGMAAAANYQGFETGPIATGASSGVIDIGSTNIGRFNSGDEIAIVQGGGTSTLAHVLYVDETANTINVVDEDGTAISIASWIKVIILRSGKRNNLQANAGSILAKDLIGTLPTSGFTESVLSGTFKLDQIVDASAVEYSDKWQSNCVNCGRQGADDQYLGNNDIVNPYHEGILGNWRPKRSYKFLTERLYSTGATNSREDGYFVQSGTSTSVTSSYLRFLWEDPSDVSQPDEWTYAQEITKYSPYGYELENRDILGRFSAAQYGYNNAFVTAVGNNMRHREIAFDGFEDYGNYFDCDDNHFRVSSADESNITSVFAHTGDYSLNISNSSTLEYDRILIDSLECSSETSGGKAPRDLNKMFEDGSATSYALDSCDCIANFAPSFGKKYVFSAWVRLEDEDYNYPNVKVNISYTGSGTTHTFETSGNVIEGWQRIYGEFEIPSSATNILVSVANTSGEEAYIDDIRIHPYHGNMKSYVYDHVNLKLKAELDANNFATFYIYDSAGKLTLIKKETREGIKTIQENRSANTRND